MIDEINKLESEISKIKEALSKLRRKGFETDLIDIYMLNLDPKIKMAKSTLLKDDIKKAEDEIEYVKGELKKLNEKDLPIHVIWAVSEANEALVKEDYALAKEKYEFIKKVYDKESDTTLKKLIHPACIKIYDELLQLHEKQI